MEMFIVKSCVESDNSLSYTTEFSFNLKGAANRERNLATGAPSIKGRRGKTV